MNTLDAKLCIAVRCPNCGAIGFHHVNLFGFPMNSTVDFWCQCKSKELTLSLKRKKGISLVIPCLACDINHTYKYSLREAVKKRLTVVCCSETGLELCFFGREKDVKDVVLKYQEDINMLLGELGL